MTPNSILPMRRVDLAVARAVAEDAGIVMPALPVLQAELSRPHVEGRVLRPEPGEPIVAFVWYWLLADGAEIMHVAVARAHRRKGYGAALMRVAMVGARERGADIMRLEVRASNAAARALYQGLGFTAVGVRPRYYSDNGEDAVLMTAAL